MAKLRIKKLGIMQMAKSYGLAFCIGSLIIAVVLLLIDLFLEKDSNTGTKSGLTEIIFSLPIIYTIVGFLTGFAISVIYNITAKLTGGLEIETEELPET
ncbi:MAG: hypothetical protein KatS3mg091_094 [Patescibacteria group bacterium]|nr:MAG: hypothetical protein KatS3mg091_094 [Patescibacteria group bacterium]